jgi:hypothetical protein
MRLFESVALRDLCCGALLQVSGDYWNLWQVSSKRLVLTLSCLFFRVFFVFCVLAQF